MTATPLRIIFAGTPKFAALHLQDLINSEHQLIAVYTQPDRPAGRGRKPQVSPVRQLAEQAGLPVYQPASLKEAATQQQLAALGADIMVVVAYGLILPQAVLDTPRLGCLNVHASLLPRWRGAAPIQRAIEAGDTTTGITIMQMDAGLDTGAMLASVSCPIGPRTSAADLLDRLAQLGPPLLLQVLANVNSHQLHGQIQDDSAATYAHKILKAEALIDWRRCATVLDRKIRALLPFPVCFSMLGDARIKIWKARPLPGNPGPAAPGTILHAAADGIVVRCGEGALVIEELQLEGGKALSTQQLLSARAHQQQFAVGRCFAIPSESAH